MNVTAASADAIGVPSRDAAASSLDEVTEEIARCREPFLRFREEVARVIVGQDRLIRGMLTGLLTGGHILVEGVPGLAKTTAVATVARAIQMSFRRLQFTPDMLPADIIGTQIYRPQDHQFEVRKGPLFAHLVLVDEINRAPAKVQSALLEAMQERQVTIAGETFPLPEPFLVVATRNPIEQEGTYPLPEAQTDRFLLNVIVEYPDRREETAILDRMGRTNIDIAVEPVLSPEDIINARDVIDRISMDPKVRDYIVSIVLATRDPYQFGADVGELIQFGVSPRGTLGLALAARVHAFLEGRGYVTPHDVKSMAHEVLRHRLILSYEAEAEQQTADGVIDALLAVVPVP